MMETYINNIPEYVERVLGLDKELKHDIQYNEVLYFRGQSNKEFKLLPSLARNSRRGTFPYERNLIESAKFKMPTIFNNNDTPINLLALLQHYGIPTRLLDVTTNPLVALYFACTDFEKDGEVIVFKNNEDDLATYPIINAIADTYRFTIGSCTDLGDFYEYVIEQPYFLEQKRTLQYASKEENGRWIEACCKEIFFVKAMELSQRQKAQQGSFILFHNKIERLNEKDMPYFVHSIEPIDKKSESIIERFIIPEKEKKNILKQLSFIGISKSSLFPDNLDFACEEIAKSQSR